ncbi:ribose ABC transporter permease [soil metagenome]
MSLGTVATVDDASASEPPVTGRSVGEFWSVYGVPFALLAVTIVFGIAAKGFLSSDNLINIFRQSAVTAIAAAGVTMVLVSGAIDISQGAVMAATGLTAVSLVERSGVPDIVAIVIALALAVVMGAGNGLLAERLRIPAFIATLGTALVIRGIAFVRTEGRSIGFSKGNGDLISWLGKGYIGPIPTPIVVMLIVYAVATVVMSRTVWGLHTYSVGSSEKASRIAGVRVARHRVSIYAAAGGLSGLAGVVLAGRLGSANPGLATGAEFDILTAAVLGGTSIYGGKGNVVRTFVGALFLSVLTNGLILLKVPTFYQPITVGIVLLAALSIDRLRSENS